MRCPSSTEKERTNPRQMEGYALASIIPSFVLLSQLFLLNQSGAMVLSDHLLHSVFMGTVFGFDSFVQCGTHKHSDSLAILGTLSRTGSLWHRGTLGVGGSFMDSGTL